MRKPIILFLLLLFSLISKSQVPFGENTGYYGSQFTDQNIYDLMYAGGARVARPFLSLQQWIQYGISPFKARFIYPHGTKGMNNNVFTFYIASPFEGGGTYTGQSTFVTSGGNRSTLPATLWDSVFTITGGDTAINTNNLYAAYVKNIYDSVAASGNYTYFEPFNEPDLNNDYVNAQYDSSMGYYGTWATVPPSPDQLINIYDSMKNIVRMYKVVYQTIHFLSGHNPAIQICAGGMSLRYFWRQFLKAGGGQWVDNLSIHNYPYYYWAYWTPTAPIGGGNARYSDMLLRINDSVYNGFQVISSQNGISMYLPHCITETNEMRWNYDTYTYPADVGNVNKYIGNDHVQRNYDIKAVCDFWRNGFSPIIFYETGDAEDSGVIASGDYHNAEGIYPNLDTSAGPPGPALLPSGVGLATMQRLLHNYNTPVTAPGAAPTGNPFTGTDGIQLDSGTAHAYVLWTQTNVDSSETPSVPKTYNFGTATYKQINYDGSSPGNVTGTVTLTGDPTFFMPVASTTPVANAGPNQTVTIPLDSVLLTGAASTGTITSYTWSQVSGPNTATLRTAGNVTTEAANLIAGVYVFKLTLNGSSLYTSTVTITVYAPLVANCGSPQTINLPTSTVTLNSSASTGDITSRLWTLAVGPATPTITTDTSTSPVITGLTIGGLYTFQLSLNGGATSCQVVITVYPIAVAGPNQTITLPVNSVYLNGSGSQGTITAWSWTQLSGPVTATINTPTKDTTTVTGMLTAGTYVYQLTVNGFSPSTVTITVNPTPGVCNCIPGYAYLRKSRVYHGPGSK